MSDIIKTKCGAKSCELLGPTGVSALNINGSTVHSKLRIKQDNEFELLNGQALYDFKRRMDKVKFIIIDEFSMIGTEMLYMIDQRLRQGKDNPSEDFGGVFLYMFGDINQLPPIGDSPVYSLNHFSMPRIVGKILYDNIQQIFTLQKTHRQNDQRFQTLLNNIGNGTVDKTDYEILEKRFVTNVSPAERKLFENAPRFFQTNSEKDNFNLRILKESKDPLTHALKPVARIPAKFNKNVGKLHADNGLENELHLSKGSKIMLRANLWTERGLVNGSVGEIIDIVYHENAIPQEDPPSLLICRFDSYKGPYLDEMLKTVPIPPNQKSNTDDAGEKFTVTQFPVCLCYACTIYKSQGLTMSQAHIDIGKTEMKPGSTYVALSRVKSLNGLLLEPFPLSRLLNINNRRSVKNKKLWLEQLGCDQN